MYQKVESSAYNTVKKSNLKGVVCTLHAGDDFGQSSASGNDAVPCAVGIVTRQDDTQLLVIQRHDYLR